MLNQMFDNVYPTKTRAFADGLLTGICLAYLGKLIYDAYQFDKDMESTPEHDTVPSTVIPS
jgi:hypothetical protein